VLPLEAPGFRLERIETARNKNEIETLAGENSRELEPDSG
jgi:hypothetical protein